MVTVITVNGNVSETGLYSFDLVIYLLIHFFQVLPIIDVANLDGTKGCSQVVTYDLLNELFEIRQIQENLLRG